MNSLKLLKVILVLSLLIAVVNFLALSLYLFWILPWLDLVLHFSGGLLVALMGVWILLKIAPEQVSSSAPLVLFVVLFSALSIGVGWELFEYFVGLHDRGHYLLDTATDILADLLGGVSAYWFLMHTRMRLLLL